MVIELIITEHVLLLNYIFYFHLTSVIFYRSNKELNSGHYLSGTITYTKDENGKKADTYPFKYVLPEPCKKNVSNDDVKDPDKSKSKLMEYAESVRELKINWLGKVGKYTILSSVNKFL